MRYVNIVFNNHILLDYLIRFNNYSIKDYLELRKVCSNFDKAIFLYIKKKYNPSDAVYYRRTMFNSRICMSCSQEKENLNCKNYYQDCYPTRISMFCNNYKCYIRTLRTWANASFINNQVVFLKEILESPDKYYIPRSDGSKTFAYLEKRYLIFFNNQIYFQFGFSEGLNRFNKICLLEDLIKQNPDKITDLNKLSKQLNPNNIVMFYDYIIYNKIISVL